MTSQHELKSHRYCYSLCQVGRKKINAFLLPKPFSRVLVYPAHAIATVLSAERRFYTLQLCGRSQKAMKLPLRTSVEIVERLFCQDADIRKITKSDGR